MTHSVDLHIHSTISDGMHTPAEIVQLALERGMHTIAITDHDAVDGVGLALEAASGTHLEVVPGVEISASARGIEVHILGYYVDHGSGDLATALARMRDSRLGRAKRMVSKLHTLGIVLSWERLLEIAGDGAVGRPHIALALVEAGHVSCVQNAFDRFLRRGGPAFQSRSKLSPARAMRIICDAGGIPVLAHPWTRTGLLGELVRGGLVGLEAFYSSYTPDMSAHLCRLARQHRLICTGGTDFHGEEIMPGNDLGGVHVPKECADRLKELMRQHIAQRRGQTKTIAYGAASGGPLRREPAGPHPRSESPSDCC